MYVLGFGTSYIRGLTVVLDSLQINGWKAIYDSYSPENEALPDPWNEKLTRIQKMIVLRCFRSDKVWGKYFFEELQKILSVNLMYLL